MLSWLQGCNKSDYTSLVSLLMSPQRLSHGSGPTVEASHDMASHAALKSLAEGGLRDKVPDNMGAGDGYVWSLVTWHTRKCKLDFSFSLRCVTSLRRQSGDFTWPAFEWCPCGGGGG